MKERQLNGLNNLCFFPETGFLTSSRYLAVCGVCAFIAIATTAVCGVCAFIAVATTTVGGVCADWLSPPTAQTPATDANHRRQTAFSRKKPGF